MLRYMKPSSTHWRHLWLCCLALSTGFWAGGAAAQTDDGGWFEGAPPPAERAAPAPNPESAPSEPDYSPPPPNFQEPAPVAPESPAEVDEDDPEAQRRAVEEFSPRLQPYGTWVDDSRYGRVWVPSRSIVGGEFVPYSTAGHWALTPDDSWIWVSDYPFGAVTFHYGRWVWASSSYWAWVPGYVYAPAWVDFHVGAAGYIGWAPLAPRYGWRHGSFFSVGIWGPAPVVFVPTRYVFVRSMPHYVVRDRVRVRSIAAQTRVYRGPRYLGRGPRPSELSIPRSALPERRVQARRVIAEPQLTSRSRTSGRVQLSSSSYTASRSVAPGRGREMAPGAALPSRSRAYTAQPRSYADPSRSYARPEAPRQSPAVRRSEQRPVQRGSVWGAERRDGSWHEPAAREQGRREQGRRDAGRATAPRALPQRSAPAVVPRERSYRTSPYGGFDGQRAAGAARGNERAAPPRATRPAPDTRRYRRGDDSNTGDSRNRGRERYGSGR